MPSILVRDLAAYNNGRYRDTWIEIDETTTADEVMARIEKMLDWDEDGDIAPSEEWAIHDSDGFHPLTIGEYTSIDKVVEIGNAIAEHGEPMAAWLSLSSDNTPEGFEDAYRQEWESEKDWAWSDFEERYPDAYEMTQNNNVPGLTFDHEDYVLQARCNWGFKFHGNGPGSVYVFESD